MGAFAFMPDPDANLMSEGEFLRTAIEQPFSRFDTFKQGAIGGALDSFGLGTAIKSLTAPEGRRMVAGSQDGSEIDQMGLWTGAPTLRPETAAEVEARGDRLFESKEAYEASPQYRADIPYSDNLTVNRAEALANYSDYRAMREEIARKRPWVAMAGNFAGSALDPINYVPVVGEFAAGATAARLGVVGGRALVGAVDAAANVGISGLLTAPVRREFGDDVSWQAQVSQMAMGAALGGLFGGVSGAFRARSEARINGAQRALEDRLATVQAGQDSMATLQDAVAGLAHDGEVSFGHASVDRLETLYGRGENAFGEFGPIDWVNPAQTFREARPAHWRSVDPNDVPGSIDAFANKAAVKNPPKAILELGPPNQRVIADIAAQGFDISGLNHVLDAGHINHALKKHGNPKKEASLGQVAVTPDDFKKVPDVIKNYTEVAPSWTSDGKPAISYLAPDGPGRIVYVEEVRAGKHALATETLFKFDVGKGAATLDLVPNFKRRTATSGMPNAHQSPGAPALTSKTLPAVPQTLSNAPAGSNLRELEPVFADMPQPWDFARPEPEALSPEVAKASAAVGKPEDLKTAAEHRGVDPEAGSFPEEFELSQLEAEGRLLPEDKALLDQATENLETAKAWGETLKAAVTCLL